MWPLTQENKTQSKWDAIQFTHKEFNMGCNGCLKLARTKVILFQREERVYLITTAEKPLLLLLFNDFTISTMQDPMSDIL